MPRRKQNSVLEDWHALFVAAPWWVPLLVAALVYAVLRCLPVLFPTAADPRTNSPSYSHALATGLAPLAPSAAGGIVLVGLIAQFGKRKRRVLLARQTGLDSLRAMSWHEFEWLVGEAFRRQGYAVEERGGNGPDGGVDLVLRRAGQTTLVQCKHWKAQRVGVPIVRELYGVMAAERADAGILVTVGGFTPDAVEFARGKILQLIHGAQLLELVRQGQASPARSALPLRDFPRPAVMAAPDVPVCPVCQGTMVRRTARKGPNAGEQFWGCAAFPQCRGTRKLEA